jgi:capsular polysaccharide biosynthesis protein
MKYIDTFKSLNPHLHTTQDIQENPTQIYTITRNPPTILRFQNEVKDKIKSASGFTDAIFTSHQVTYPYQTIRKTRNVIGRISVIDAQTQWGNTYYHFLTEVLPSVLFIKTNNPVCVYYSPFVVPFMQWFGVTNNIIFDMPAYRKESIDQPYIECGNPSPEKIETLRKNINEKVSYSSSVGILIYREEPLRKILNNDDTLQMLKQKYPDLEWIVFNKLPVQETIQLFSKAKVIAGPHGAGFTNMLFSQNGTTIIEFMSLEAPNICYWHLSEILQNKYYMIPCQTNNLQFTIDTETVSSLLPNI